MSRKPLASMYDDHWFQSHSPSRCGARPWNACLSPFSAKSPSPSIWVILRAHGKVSLSRARFPSEKFGGQSAGFSSSPSPRLSSLPSFSCDTSLGPVHLANTIRRQSTQDERKEVKLKEDNCIWKKRERNRDSCRSIR